MLVHRYGDGLLRMKGLLSIEGSDQPAVVHGVHRLIHAPVHLDAWPDEDRRSRIVLIGDVPPEAELQESLERFLSWR
jgi:G3E family GTPase